MEATLVGFESRRLLEIDTEEKIGEIADSSWRNFADSEEAYGSTPSTTVVVIFQAE